MSHYPIFYAELVTLIFHNCVAVYESWVTISRSSQCSTTGVTKAVVYAILFVHIKEPLLLIGKSSPCVGSMFPLII